MRQIGRKGKLVLKDGSVYRGTLYGKRNAVGEVVFTTGMSGYQETLTDPSFCDQIVVMTYPLVGNYGINKDFNQGRRCFFQGYVISELCDHPSNWKNEKSLEDFLDEQDVPVLVGVDTRAITRKLRNYGVLQGVIVPDEMPQEEVDKLLALPEGTSLTIWQASAAALPCSRRLQARRKFLLPSRTAFSFPTARGTRRI